jgi:hypothetical protein
MVGGVGIWFTSFDGSVTSVPYPSFLKMAKVELDGVLRSSGGFVLWSIYTPLKQEYTAFVAWLTDRRVKAHDSYLPSS